MRSLSVLPSCALELWNRGMRAQEINILFAPTDDLRWIGENRCTSVARTGSRSCACCCQGRDEGDQIVDRSPHDCQDNIHVDNDQTSPSIQHQVLTAHRPPWFTSFGKWTPLLEIPRIMLALGDLPRIRRIIILPHQKRGYRLMAPIRSISQHACNKIGVLLERGTCGPQRS